ncbi:anthranilate synthase family protein [Verrucosispora sp. WMMA2044]|uniref:anthranilate synthase family protein n=1 Tax=Verrucosispora sp. WMMA2044 TaxID=3016419 RepID=UPI00248BDCA3|nr:anthranilate synthase family protein [Verrucosispora sp. WMMA2044]WBB50411.1 anthranilate synthase family protein [Verrucosispora sp. WMMA2044]
MTDPADVLAGLGQDGSAFALLHRPHSLSGSSVEVLVGDISTVDRLADLPLPETPGTSDGVAAGRADLLTVVPYRQITEHGFACRDDGAPLLAMRIRDRTEIDLAQAVALLPVEDVSVVEAGFDIDDPEYAEIVRRIMRDEIGNGAGSNFVIRRSFLAQVRDYSVAKELSVFRRLVTSEAGAYWTFLIHTGSGTFIGASPELHVGLVGGAVTMNPISGTYRHPPEGPDLRGLLEFLGDPKESNELYMVVDEELKMMARICPSGGRARGPFLKEMASLTHTEYLLQGPSDLDVREVLRTTLLAPTVTGSPLENAFRVISRHETTGRGYYGGFLALIGRDGLGQRTLDSAIMIRTAEIDAGGRLRLGVGATLVRDSDPDSEVAETRTKVAGMLRAFGLTPGTPDPVVRSVTRSRPPLSADPRVRQSLQARNSTLSTFWLDGAYRIAPDPALQGRRVLVVDGEDRFTAMLGHQLRALGLHTRIARYDEPVSTEAFEIIVVGPGPGDPRDTDDRRIGALRALTRELLIGSKPFLSICLGHQVLAAELGLEIVRLPVPNQGVQRVIDLFGRPERVAFYNTYSARCEQDQVFHAGLRQRVQVSRDGSSGQVHALRGPHFRSVQFHPESVLTQHGPQILSEFLGALVPVPVPLTS